MPITSLVVNAFFPIRVLLKRGRFVLASFLLLGFVLSYPCGMEGKQSSAGNTDANDVNKICLTMLVKNNEAYLEECLNSVKEVIDCICICDLGSTDRTLAILGKFLEETRIPGKIYLEKPKNSAQGPTFSVQAAQKMLGEKGFSLNQTYLLVIEPDMLVQCEAEFDKRNLDKDAYLLLEKSSTLSMYNYNAHLLRASLPWTSKGVVQTSWNSEKPYAYAKLKGLVLEEQGDAAYKRDKLKRNLTLLTHAIAEEPDDLHHLFFLAQSHKCLNNYAEAIKWFKARIEKPGDKEEFWFAKFMIGMCYEELGEWDQALHWYLEAYQANRERTDSLHKIASHYRRNGQNDLAYIFAKHGSRIPYADNQNLYNFPPLQDYHFDEELSIAAYYTRFREEGFAAINALLLNKQARWEAKEQAHRNLIYYLPQLKNIRLEPIIATLPPIEEGSEEHYHPMNPSILKTERGYTLNCRSVNYTQTGAKIFNTSDSTGYFRTRNFLIEYDRDFNVLSQKEIVENLPRQRIRSCIVEGLEDCRLVEFDKSLWFTCTTSDTNPTGTRQISLCKLEKKKWGDQIQVEKLVPLKGPDPYRCEKNWMPFAKEGELLAIYSCAPFTIYKINTETGAYEIALEYEPEHDFTRFRGSAAPIAFDEGYLVMVHEVTHFSDLSRCYMHRFLYLDNNYKVKKLSKPFTFKHLGVEFCCSMVINHAGNELVMTIGVEDREAYLGFIGLNTLRTLLEPLPSPNEPFFQ